MASLASACATRAAWPIHAHSHNDYERARPLWDALDAHFDSVEADLFWVDGQILVSHHGKEFRGTLEQLYLDPLQERVTRLGSVHGDDCTFYLWLDLKEGNAELRAALFALLSRYEMFERFGKGEAKSGAVVAILTGDAVGKTTFIDEHPVGPACRDGNGYSPEDPPADTAWRFYALNFRTHVGEWNGSTPIPKDLQARMIDIVRDVHQKGRKIRFWKAPDGPEYWQAALDAGVDFVQTDNPKALAAFLRASSRSCTK